MAGILSHIARGVETIVTAQSCRAPPQNPVIINLNSLLADIYVRYIAIEDAKLQEYYNVFTEVFRCLNDNMKQACPYYNQYSGSKQFAGSHYDRLRINKPDDFPDEDVDIVIRLPLNYNGKEDIEIENKAPGYIQLKGGVKFQKLPQRDGVSWMVNKAAWEWKDDRWYLCRSKFINWFKGVVTRGLNKFQKDINGMKRYNVNGITYSIGTSESGPAITLIIENKAKHFKLDVDLVPAIRFPENRWPISQKYRGIPAGCNREYWMVVPKPNKGATNDFDTNRSWRVAMHDQEAKLIYGKENLRQTMRFMKKLRSSLKMDKIASYYVKTLFFWEIVDQTESFWRQDLATLFKYMVKKFHTALNEGKILYFWQKENNLIGNIDRGILTGYARTLKQLIDVLENSSEYKRVAKFLLADKEFIEYNQMYLHCSKI